MQVSPLLARRCVPRSRQTAAQGETGERQPEEAAKNLSKSPSSESEVLQGEPNLVAWPQVQFPDIIQFIARQYRKYISSK